MYREGIFVRSTSNIDEGRIVRIAPFGTILKATGKVRGKGARIYKEGVGIVLFAKYLLVFGDARGCFMYA